MGAGPLLLTAQPRGGFQAGSDHLGQGGVLGEPGAGSMGDAVFTFLGGGAENAGQGGELFVKRNFLECKNPSCVLVASGLLQCPLLLRNGCGPGWACFLS